MPESIGQQLQQARQERGISLEEAAQATRIRLRFIQALEADQFSDLPSVAQIRGFLRNYAVYLGLPAQPLLDSWQLIYAPAQKPDIVDNKKSGRNPFPPANQSRVWNLTPAEDLPAHPGVQPDNNDETSTFSETPTQDQPSQLIFIEIGETLQKQRELLSLSLTEVERYTHLRNHYLKAMEAGNLEELPSPVQARGMLSNYARFLSLDSEKIINRFADGLQARHRERTGIHPLPPSGVTRVPTRPALKRFLSMDLLFGGGMIVLLVSFMVWGASQIMAMRSQDNPEPTAPPVAEVLLASVNPGVELTITATATRPGSTVEAGLVNVDESILEPSQTTTAATMIPVREGELQLFIIAHQRSWMQVIVDNKIVFTGRTIPGGNYTYIGKNSVELISGNAGALQVLFNQNDLGSLGSSSEVIHLVFTDEGLVSPTPTITPTPSPTLRETATPTPSITPRPSATPRSTIPSP